MEQQKRNFWILAIVLLLLEAVLFVGANKQLDQEYLSKLESKERIVQTLDNVPLEARAVAIYDFTEGEEIYAKNGDMPLPIASLTKVMTVVTALNELDEDQLVPISFDALMRETDYGFFVNERFSAKDLSKFTLIGSANDGAYALFEQKEDFLERMNDKARRIGMENTLFLNPTGLDQDPETPGAFASARDINVLSLYALRAHPEVFIASSDPDISIESIDGFLHSIENTNTSLTKIPDLVFSKTGHTGLAGGSLTIVYKNKASHLIAITVLGSTKEGRFTDIEKLVATLEGL